MQGQSIEVLLPERFRAAHAQHLGAFADSRGPIRMMGMGRLKGLRTDGQEIDLEGQISQVTVNQQPILIANLKDVTDHLRTHAEFDLSQRQLSELTKKLMTQEKRLVKRLAQALHDQLGQTMAAIRMAHETIITLNKSKVPPALERVQTQMGKLTVTLLQLVVLDNGVGIAAGALQQTGHLGIISMQEQSQAIGATVCVGPGQELGTFVSFKWECAQ